MPEIPSSSLADIAFLLLIFFLVTTTMDIDSGLERRLPPWVPEDQVDDNTPPIKERNVFVVLVNKENQLLVEGELCQVKDLREKAKEFLTNPRRLENLPEMESKTFDIIGDYEVIHKSAVISLRNDVGTTYSMYIEVQNELVAAINELRETFAADKFNKKYKDLTEEERDIVTAVFPQKISEAEPKKVGGGN